MAKHEAVERKYDAVDRLMAMATDERADRPAMARVPVPVPEPASAQTALRAPSVGAGYPQEAAGEQGEPKTAVERGRQLWNAVRPLLPMVAGAMRMVDHGAVQALARLLPLVGGGAFGLSAGEDENAAASRLAAEEQAERALRALQAAQQATRSDLDLLRDRASEADAQISKLRLQNERAAADTEARTQEVRALNDRVRLLTAGTIILLMLVVAQMILLVVIFHR